MLTVSGRLKNIGALVSSSGISICGLAGVGLGEGVGVSVGVGLGVVSVGSVVVTVGTSSLPLPMTSGILQPVKVDMEIAAVMETAAKNLKVLRILVLIISNPRTSCPDALLIILTFRL